MSQEKKQLTLEQQQKVREILKEAVLIAGQFEEQTAEVPDGVYFTALAILVQTAKEEPGFEVAQQLVANITDFAKKMQTN